MDTGITTSATLEDSIGQHIANRASDHGVDAAPPLPEITAEQAQQLYESRAGGGWRQKAAELISESTNAAATWAADVEANRTRVREQEQAAREQRDLDEAMKKAAEQERKAEATAIELLRARAVFNHGLTPQQGELITGTTSDQIAAQVEAVMKLTNRR